MSHYQHKKRYSGESDNYSTASDSRHECNKNDGCNQCHACIICPPVDHRETYETESSDHSCPDFSDLCKDQPRECQNLKDSCKQCKKEKKNCSCDKDRKNYKDHKGYKKYEQSETDYEDDEYYDSDDSESEYDDRYDGQNWNKGNCNSCNSCNGRGGGCRFCVRHDADDYSRSAVAHALGSDNSHSDYSCPDLSYLACDVERKCKKSKEECKDKNCKEHKEQHSDEESEEATKTADKGDNSDLSNSKTSEKTEKKESTASSSGRGKKFVVSYGPKQGHPWAEYNSDDGDSIYINGKNGPVLHLYRGCTYFFCVEQCGSGHAFVLTNKPNGGRGSKIIPGGFEPVSKGCVSLKVDKCTPRYFFYQDAFNSYEGGLVIVHDK